MPLSTQGGVQPNDAVHVAAVRFCDLSPANLVLPRLRAAFRGAARATGGGDATPDRFASFACDSTRGLHIHPNIRHGALAPLDDEAEFLDRQGSVHARLSVDFPKEFGRYLSSSLCRP